MDNTSFGRFCPLAYVIATGNLITDFHDYLDMKAIIKKKQLRIVLFNYSRGMKVAQPFDHFI